MEKYYRREIHEAFKVTASMVNDQGRQLRTLIPGVIMTEITLNGQIILNTRLSRIAVTQGCWIVRSPDGKYKSVDEKTFLKDYEPIK